MSGVATSKSQRGLSLIELLVSIVIALIVISGVINVVLTSRSTFETEQEASFIQENARFALEILSRDIRMAGSAGCTANNAAWYANIVTDDGTGLFSLDGIDGFEGTANVAGFPTALADADVGSDAIILRYADPEAASPIGSHNVASSTFGLLGDHEIEAGDRVVVVDASCRHFGYFVASAATATQVRHEASAANCTNELYSVADVDCPSVSGVSQPYSPGSVLMPYRVTGYFIDDSNVLPGSPALKRRVYTSAGQRSEELAQGVESLEILYGVDETGTPDGEVDVYLDADDVADWERVLSVQFTLVLRSQFELFEQNQAITLNGTNYNDRFLRQISSSTVRIRNR